MNLKLDECFIIIANPIPGTPFAALIKKTRIEKKSHFFAKDDGKYARKFNST
jgi:hypothetical protein